MKYQFNKEIFIPGTIIDISTQNADFILAYLFVHSFTNYQMKLIFNKQMYYEFVNVVTKKAQLKKDEALHKILCLYGQNIKIDNMDYLNVKNKNTLIIVDIKNKLYTECKKNKKSDENDNKKNYQTYFAILEPEMLNKIFNGKIDNKNESKDKSASLQKIILFYAYYCFWKLKRKFSEDIHHKPNFLYKFNYQIYKDLNIADKTLRNIIDFLVDHDVMRVKQLKRINPNGDYENDVTLFTEYREKDKFHEYSHDDELFYAEKFIKNTRKYKDKSNTKDGDN